MDDAEIETIREERGSLPADAEPARSDRFLVVSGSRVTGIVISRIVERAGFKCDCVNAAELDDALAGLQPAAIIIDDDPRVATRIADLRRSVPGQHGRTRPVVILLVTDGPARQAGQDSPHVDSVVVKPIMPENLQPLLYDIDALARS